MESLEKLEMLTGERMFQQGNDTKHTHRRAAKWFEDNNIDVMTQPAQSTDINPINHLWVDLKDTLKTHLVLPKELHELWNRVVKEWNKIPPETYKNLIESMPRRIQAVIKVTSSPSQLDSDFRRVGQKTVPVSDYFVLFIMSSVSVQIE